MSFPLQATISYKHIIRNEEKQEDKLDELLSGILQESQPGDDWFIFVRHPIIDFYIPSNTLMDPDTINSIINAINHRLEEKYERNDNIPQVNANATTYNVGMFNRVASWELLADDEFVSPETQAPFVSRRSRGSSLFGNDDEAPFFSRRSRGSSLFGSDDENTPFFRRDDFDDITRSPRRQSP